MLTDILLLGVALVVFALFHHVLPRREEAVGTLSQRVSSEQTAIVEYASVSTPEQTLELTVEPTVEPTIEATAEITPQPTPEPTASPTAEPTAEPTPEPTATPDPVGYFGTKYADKFTDGEVVQTESSYQSANVNVTVTQTREYGADIYVADIYIRDISCLQSVFSEDTFGRGYADWPWEIAAVEGRIVTINGDFYGTRDNGVVIRNGVLYREDENIKRDVGVIYWDGTMKCFSPDDFDTEAEMARGAYQAWNFGPMLLDEDGKAMTEFNSKVNPANPRAVLGYFEPGHYCMVVADGRSRKSAGVSLKNMSIFLEELGCKAAYNMDGGETAVMAYCGEVISVQAGNGRQCSDFISIVDAISEGSVEPERGDE